MSLQHAWYARAGWLRLLRPLSALFTHLVRRRCRRLRQLGAAAAGIPVPVIIVGNISIGGTGKTPLTIALIEILRRHGYRPGVVSRGYGAKPPTYPWTVTADSRPSEGGDEPCLIVQRTGVPLVIDPNRVEAVRTLLQDHACNLIISDDGLQHYALARDIEIAVVDGVRGLGNGRCLPEGPLREPPERLASVDWVVINGGDGVQGVQGLPVLAADAVQMQLAPMALVPLQDGPVLTGDGWPYSRRVHALAGIGNPSRFFDTLRRMGFDPIEHPLMDHAEIQPEMLELEPQLPIIMTEKDAVKCRQLTPENCWALRVDAQLPEGFEQQLIQRLAQLSAQQTGQNDGSQTA